jgi:hypothetical protein
VREGTDVPFTVQFQDLTYLVSESRDNPTYFWDFGDGTSSTEQDPLHEYTAPGLYTVSLTVTDEWGNEDTEVKETFIAVNATPPLRAEFTGPDRNGSTATLTDQSSGDVTGWLWDFGDGTTSTEQNPGRHRYPDGFYTVTLTVYGPDIDGDGVADSSHTHVEEDFCINEPSSVTAYTDIHYKSHYGGKVIVDKSSINLRPEELKYKRLFFLACWSGEYFLGALHRGKTFFTHGDWRSTNTIPEYVKRYIRGDSDQEILNYLNSVDDNDIYRFYDFDQKPPSMR